MRPAVALRRIAPSEANEAMDLSKPLCQHDASEDASETVRRRSGRPTASLDG